MLLSVGLLRKLNYDFFVRVSEMRIKTHLFLTFDM